MGGYVQRRIDRSKITTNNQFDGIGYNPALSDGETLTKFSYHYWDGSIGISFNSSIQGSETDYYFIGLAYHHFNRPKNSFYQNPPIELNPKVVSSGGVNLSINDISFIHSREIFPNREITQKLSAGITYSRKIR